MELLAENRFTITKKLFYEGMLRVTEESYGSFAKKVLLFLAVAWAILAVVTLMGSGSLSYVVLAFVVVLVIGAWLTVFIRGKTRRAWAALESRSGGDLERVTRFYSSYLEADNGSEEITVFYEDIRNILQSEHLLVLLSVEKVGILVTRDGFLSGDLAVVQTLIEGEMGNAQC